jgi:hypothetical protein
MRSSKFQRRRRRSKRLLFCSSAFLGTWSFSLGTSPEGKERPLSCKPDSVSPAFAEVDDHFSPRLRGSPLARTATNTRGYDGRAALPLFCLAPREVCRAAPVTRTRGGLLPHPFTLTCALAGHRRYALCCTVCPAALTLPSPSFERRVALRCPDFPQPCKQDCDHPESGKAKLRLEVPRSKFEVPKNSR